MAVASTKGFQILEQRTTRFASEHAFIGLSKLMYCNLQLMLWCFEISCVDVNGLPGIQGRHTPLS